MCPDITYGFELVAGKYHVRRGVGFLTAKNSKDINAKSIFDGLVDKKQRYMLSSFDSWIGGQNIIRRYHGWDKSEFGGKYIKCYVFKLKDNRVGQRFYGFLCNPIPDKPYYELCVLISRVIKKEHETDATALAHIEYLRINSVVDRAVKKAMEKSYVYQN